MKKFAVIAMLMVAVFVTGCAGQSDSESSIHVFNWGNYINPDVVQMFEEEYGITVIYSTFESNESMYTTIAMGGNVYDVLFPSDYMIYRMIQEELLRPINFDNVPNISHVSERFMGLEFDPQNRYSAPYKWGTLGILYNTTMVNSVIDSWEALWNPDYANLIFMYNSERDSMAVALKLLGYSLNSTNEDEINRARDLLIEQRPLVRAYVTDVVKDLMIAGEAALAVVYSGDAVFTMMHNPDLNYVIPREGSNLWVDAMVVPHNANNPEGAEAFINFMLRPEIAAMNTNFIGYTTANATALEMGLIDPALMEMPGFDITDEEYRRLEVFIDLGEFRDVYTRAFTTVLGS
ncbi:MAG: spermidine/putrescine ABC transporter substrate-binding protein [Defluviitaleaceae bacterium]|nr:spermidine/putrescine ABC transporter substrate-binding protein [Defluviitaleaceae bacterium]